MRKQSTWITLILVTVGMLTILGCGGGGGSSEAVNYEGVNTPAVLGTVDTASMVSLAKRAALAGEEAQEVSPLSVDTAGMPSDPVEMVNYAKKMLSGSSVPVAQPLSVVQPLAMDCYPAQTMTDGSGGYMTVEYCAGSTSEKITVTAVGYDDGFEAVDGQVIMEGTSTKLTIIFRDYYYDDYSSQDYYADGIVRYEENSSTRLTITYDLSLYDYNTSDGYWLNNYKLVVDEDSVNEEDTVSISGRFYDFDNGYVDIQTVSPVVVPWNQDFPTSGELQMTGDAGYWIKIRFRLNVSTPEYQVEINADADPDYDWISAWEPWVI